MAAPFDQIHSRDNPLVKRIRSLQRSSVRNQERAFFVEGLRAVNDAFAAGIAPELLVLSEDFDIQRVSVSPVSVSTRTLSKALFNELSDTATPQGIMAIVPMQFIPPGPADPTLTVIADGISDPGNLGTLLRSCAGAGVTAVYLAGHAVDPYNPKVVRAAMGAHFKVPVDRLDPSNSALFPIETAVVATYAGSSLAYDQVDMTGPTVIIVGSEATGVSDALSRSATATVSIPMASNMESLNAAIAGSLLVFEAQRQRRNQRRNTAISA